VVTMKNVVFWDVALVVGQGPHWADRPFRGHQVEGASAEHTS
jgi:hypothetical protein